VNQSRPVQPDERRRHWGPWALAVVLLAYATLALGSAHQKSVTVDELGHLPSGVYFLTTGDPRYASLNPPLVNALSALPVFFLDLEHPLEPPPVSDDVFSFWATGYHFQEMHRSDYVSIFAAARWVPILIVAALGVLLYAWGREFSPTTPEISGLLVAGFFCLSPNVLAHARLVGTDTGTAFFITLALWSLHRMLGNPSPATVSACGAALGLALLAKFYALLLLPTFLVVTFAWHRFAPEPGPPLRHRFASLAAVAAVALLVFDSGYAWREVGVSLADVTLQSELFQSWQATGLGQVPLPIPGAFLRAVDGQLSEVASPIPSYLFGESFEGGRWYTYLALLAIKTPLGLFAAFGLALLLSSRHSLPRHELALLLTYPAFLIVVLSLSNGRQLGTRALLSAVPLVWLWAAATIAGAAPRRWPVAVASAALAATLGASLATYPDYISYFNPFAGGKDGGYRYTAEGNVDIGQDLVQLARYLENQGEEHIQLLYFGSVDPALYGIDFEIPVDAPKPGLLAVSVSLYHMPYLMFADGELHTVGPAQVNPALEPIARIGGSIHVYRLGP
jgi:4-amino-4-deoxy-L-arabinose transferase-like glycosyltransferase